MLKAIARASRAVRCRHALRGEVREPCVVEHAQRGACIAARAQCQRDRARDVTRGQQCLFRTQGRNAPARVRVRPGRDSVEQHAPVAGSSVPAASSINVPVPSRSLPSTTWVPAVKLALTLAELGVIERLKAELAHESRAPAASSRESRPENSPGRLGTAG